MHTAVRAMRPSVFSVSLLAIVLVLLGSLASAQNVTDPLKLFKNYFVTGDYVVGGVGLRGSGVNGWATGKITISGVPQDGVVVGAFLYWEAIEATDVASTQAGFFQGYSITGAQVTPPGQETPPCWSSGGGTGQSQGAKHLRVYRADVAPYLVNNGQYSANGTYVVQLQDSGSTGGGGTPLTEGASLVIVYRTLYGQYRSVVLYDGSWTMNNATPYFYQTIKGFYDAAPGTNWKLTHIVGDGQANFSELLYFNGNVSGGNAFTGGTLIDTNPFQGTASALPTPQSWDNKTYPPTFPGPTPSVSADASLVTTYVTQQSSNSDCLSWGAVVFSTPVMDSDGDGLLDSWESAPTGSVPGYTDVKTGQRVDLPDAKPDRKDLYVQVDYLNNSANPQANPPELKHSHLPKYSALQKIGEAFQYSGGMRIHFDVGAKYQNIAPSGNDYSYIIPHNATDPWQGGNSLDEDLISCSDGTTLCEFRYPDYGPGIVWWKGSINFAKNSINPATHNPFFEYGRKDSYHYVLMGHALGLPSEVWSRSAGTLTSISVNSTHQATITLTSPIDAQSQRITISGAVGDLNLNGTYQIIGGFGSSTITVNTPNVAVPAPLTSVYFGYNLGNLNTNPLSLGTYVSGNVKYVNEPNLVVAAGAPLSTSGFSDLGGGDSLVTLGLWSADDSSTCQSDPSQSINDSLLCNNQVGSSLVQAGTIMHEIGHTLFLTHGSFYPNYPAQGQNSFGQNCKPDYLSVMNYQFQIRGLPDRLGTPDANLNKYVDFSGQTLLPLDENTLVEANGLGRDILGNPPRYGTRWFAPPSFLDNQIQAYNLNMTGGNHILTHHCDGSPSNTTAVRVDGPTVTLVNNVPIPIGVNWNNQGAATDTVSQDISFDGFLDSPLGAPLPNPLPSPAPDMDNDWLHMNFLQLGARRNIGGYSASVNSSDLALTDQGSQILGGGSQILGGGSQILGGGSQILGGGSDLVNSGSQILGGGSQILGGGSQILGGGSQILGGGSQILGGGVELDFQTANTVVDPPVNLFVTSPAKKTAYLTWLPPGFGQIRAYYVWRVDVSKNDIGPNNLPVVVMTIGSLTSGTPPPRCSTDATIFCWTDTGVKTNYTYKYFVTAALGSDSGPNAGNQSGPSNIFQIVIK